MKLVQINQDGTSEVDSLLSELGKQVAQANCENYKRSGFEKPWCAYFAVVDGKVVGSCAFKTPIKDGAVEIAYFTFPEFEKKGYATQMAQALIKIAKESEESVRVTAQTLPQENVSTRILTRLGFVKTGSLIHPEDGEVWAWELKDE